MPTTSISFRETPLLNLVLRRADDALILGHRLSEWCGHAPMVEEDIALANIALDLVGQARSLYDYAAQVEGSGLTEDHFAYRREQHQYRNCLLVEQPNGDFAATIVRQVLFSAFMEPFLREATLIIPNATWMQIGGRSGRHTEHLGYILADLQFLQRAHPEAVW